MASAPTLTLRTTSGSLITGETLSQAAPDGDILPTKEGETSDVLTFRVYNNYALTAGIATALNVYFTIFDGSGSGSHTCAVLPVSQSWLQIYLSGYGENSVDSPDRLTYYLGTDTAIGGCPAGANSYVPEHGSDGGAVPQIRAFSTQTGMGFLELRSYLKVPAGSSTANYTFALSIHYEWAA